jgi:hypothetical protein
MKVKKIRTKHVFILFITAFLVISCGENLFKNLSTQDTSDAIFEDALKLIDSQDYNDAIAKILSLPAEYQQNTEVREALAGAYAGQCGMNFVNLVTELGKSSTETFFKQLMNVYQTKDPVITGCLQSETIMKNFGSAAVRTADQNFFLLIYGFAKIGLFLRNFADTNKDGVTDATFNVCQDASISDTNVKELFIGLGLILENFSGITSQIANANAGTGITSITTLCTNAGLNCAITDVASVTDPTSDSFRDILNTNYLGIGSCALTDLAIVGCCP